MSTAIEDIQKQDADFENSGKQNVETPPVETKTDTQQPENKVETTEKEDDIDLFNEEEDIVAKKAKEDDEEEDPNKEIEENDDKLLEAKIAKAIESNPRLKQIDEREAKADVRDWLLAPENQIFKKHEQAIVKLVQNPKLKSVFKADKLVEVAALLAAGRSVWGSVKQVQDNADTNAQLDTVTPPNQRQESDGFNWMTATPEQVAKREAQVLAGKAKI